MYIKEVMRARQEIPIILLDLATTYRNTMERIRPTGEEAAMERITPTGEEAVMERIRPTAEEAESGLMHRNLQKLMLE